MSSSASKSPQHLIRLRDLPQERLDEFLQSARAFRADPKPTGRLAGQTLGMLFFRISLRTRISLQVAVHQLGGDTINLSAMSDLWELEERKGIVMDGRASEHIQDAAAVLSHYCDALAIRPACDGKSWDRDREDAQIESWARFSNVPVINLESVLWHPLQGLADRLTLHDCLGAPAGKRIAVIWVHSTTPASPAVVHTLLNVALRDGMNVTLAHPPGFELDESVIQDSQELAKKTGCELTMCNSMEDAVEGAHVVYARSWQSREAYGNSTLEASRRSRLQDWRVSESLMGLGDDARLMHAMPIRRNLEVTDDVLDGERSLVYTQAENRLHTEKALLDQLLR